MSVFFENYITRGFWGDEAWTALISRLTVPEIIQVTGQDFHPPLYYLLVHFFMRMFGESEAIRAISTFFWVLTLWPTYVLAKKLTQDELLAKVSTVTIALSPILFTYAFEARAYALLTFLSVVSTLFFWSAVQSVTSLKKKTSVSPLRSRWWLAYVAVAAVGVYTHYYMWFILASHGFYWLFFNRRQFWWVFGVYASVFLVQLPWLPVLFSQLKSVAGNYWIGALDSRTHWEYFFRVVGGDTDIRGRLIFSGAVLALLLVGTFKMLGHYRQRIPQGYLLLLMWWLIPVLLPSLISFYRPVFFYRYLVFTSVPILMLTLWGAAQIKRELSYLVAAVIAIVFLRTDAAIFAKHPHTAREEMQKVVDQLAAPSHSTVASDQKTHLYTVLPSFAEVYFYTLALTDGQELLRVRPVGLVQASGKSLLDKYVERGEVTIQEFSPTENYWLIEPGPKSTYHTAE